MRLFFAILAPEQVVQAVTEEQERVRAIVGEDGVRWTKPPNIHYTVKFLGEQPPEMAGMAIEVARSVREASGPFELSVGGWGAFPNERRPSVLWIGATVGNAEFGALAKLLEARLHHQGFPRERRAQLPHLTIARIKGYAGEIAAAQALKTPRIAEIGRFTVDHFVLMRSTPTPAGSEYTVVSEFELNG